MLAGAYWPVLVFAALFVTARIARFHRHQRQAALR